MQKEGKPDADTGVEVVSRKNETRNLDRGYAPASRLFPADSVQLSDEVLLSLGESVPGSANLSQLDSQIPAGYTFLNQFIEHDITCPAGQTGLPGRPRRRLDLVSVYGNDETANLLRDLVYPDRMIEGQTIGTGDYGVLHSLPADLPRIVSGSRPGRALIGDERNDQNLGVAQIHLLFLKLHNRFVDTGMDYHEARNATVQHYQSMIINDYLSKILDPGVFNAVLRQPGYICFGPGSVYLPLEFTTAVFRFFYSMFKADYEWNHVHKKGGLASPVKIAQLFQLSELCGNLGGQTRLPTHWIIDWRHFFDFGVEGQNPRLNMARKISAGPVSELDTLFEFPDWKDYGSQNLAARILMQGQQLQLASGQTLVDILNERGLILQKLCGEQLRTGFDILNLNTPLWYYILRESEVQQNGDRLGEIGSWLVADTFKRLILDSPNSVLNDTGFSAHAEILNDRKTITMPGIIEFTDNINPLLKSG